MAPKNMDDRLFDGLTAFVTGAGSGIGRAVAWSLAEQGASVVAVDRRGEAAEGTVQAMRGHGLALQADVCDSDAVTQAVALATASLGDIAIMVTCAGIYAAAPLESVSDEQWQHVVRTNLTATYLCCRAVIGTMYRRRQGTIVTMASELGIVGRAGAVAYAASKAAVIGFTRALALEAAPYRVRVNCVAPGPVDTPLLRAIPDEYTDAQQATIPLGRWGTPDDIAAAVVFLASSRAAFYTGQTISPNGGVVM